MKHILFIFIGLFIWSCNAPIHNPGPESNRFGVSLTRQDTFEKIASDLDYYSRNDIDLIKIEFGWKIIQPHPMGELDQMELNRLKEIIKDAGRLNVKVILGMSGISSDHKIDPYYIADLWTKVAGEFKNFTNIYAYKLSDSPDMECTEWTILLQEVIDNIRLIDNRTYLMINGVHGSYAQDWTDINSNMIDIKDPVGKLIYAANVFFDRSGMGNYTKFVDDDFVSIDVGVLRTVLFVEWLKTNKRIGFISSFAVPGNDQKWLETLDMFLEYMYNNNIKGTYSLAGAGQENNVVSIQPTDNYSRRKSQLIIIQKYNYM